VSTTDDHGRDALRAGDGEATGRGEARTRGRRDDAADVAQGARKVQRIADVLSE